MKQRSSLSLLHWMDWVITAVALGAIFLGLWPLIYLNVDQWLQVRSRGEWSDIANPFFALGSGLLFLLALRLQLREHRHALAEMEENNANHEELLLIAKQEKKFNVCLSAISDVREQITSYRLYSAMHPVTESMGAKGLLHLTDEWRRFFAADHIGATLGRAAELINDVARAESQVLPDYMTLDVITVKLVWLRDAIAPANTELEFHDREYLSTLILPMLSDVGVATQYNINQASEQIDGLLKNQDQLARWGIKDQALRHWKGRLDKILSRYRVRAKDTNQQ